MGIVRMKCGLGYTDERGTAMEEVVVVVVMVVCCTMEDGRRLCVGTWAGADGPGGAHGERINVGRVRDHDLEQIDEDGRKWYVRDLSTFGKVGR